MAEDKKNGDKGKATSAGGIKKNAPTGKSSQAKEKASPGKRPSPAANRAEEKQKMPSHYVGIGSSAGGLEALKEFFQHTPANSGMAYILVPHLDPNSKSIMHELLQKFTSMPVIQVRDNTRVTADSVYIIPPDKMLGIIDGSLQLMEAEEKHGLRHPIDFFFRSLSQDQRDCAIAVILSGSGTEGVIGTKAIKGEGGVVIAQDPASAKFDSMPAASIATGMVDWILPPAEIPQQLIRYAARMRRKAQPPEKMLTDDGLKKIFLLIRSRIGHDFSMYKPKTIMRRISRRMDINQLDSIDEYIRYVQKNPDEIELLFKELLIRVTNFFRDPDTFAVFQEKVLPYVMKHADPEQPIRVWVPACSTGEEAYSIAILLDEYMHKASQFHNVQIFATDIDEEAINKARRGIYPASISVDVSEQRLQRYFKVVDNNYQVKKGIRESIVFATQNIIKDPPLSRIDLICCRNLLIYFSSALQNKVMAIFHYALKPHGILFLGTSETIGASVDLFTPLDAKGKIFRAVGKSVYQHDLHFTPRFKGSGSRDEEQLTGKDEEQQSFDDLIRRMLLELYAPASVIIKDDGTILYFFGRTGKYLEPAQGRAKLNIFDMARQGLKNTILEAVKRIKMGQQEVAFQGVGVRTNGGSVTCTLKVMRISRPEPLGRLMLVVFEEETEEKQQEEKKGGAPKGRASRHRVAELEEELKNVREHLQTTIEELETSNEELQSANEELQSTNEELETSREELQSVNEELMTVNAEAQEKIEQLTLATNDMKNLLGSTEIATVFLDAERRVKSFTPDATRIFKLIESDVGRPISDITNTLEYDRLEEDMNQVLDTLVPQEQQVLDSRGFWYLMRVLPYRTQNNYIDGLVLTFVDITKQKIAEVSLAESEEMRASMIDQSEDGFIIADGETGSITDTNPAFQEMTGRRAGEMKGMKFWDLIPRQEQGKARQRFFGMVKKSKPDAKFSENFIMEDGSHAQLQMTGRVITIGNRKYLQSIVHRK